MINYKGTKIFTISLCIMLILYSFGENVYQAGMYASDEIANEISQDNQQLEFN